MKRRLLLALLVLLIATVCQIVAIDQAAGNATAWPDHITLTWTGNPSTTITITWRTDSTITTGFVKCWKVMTMSNPPQQAKLVRAGPSNFTTDLQATHLFTATLTGLLPNTKYSYQVGEGNHWSNTYTFSTADPKTRMFKFLVFGDSQSPATGSSPYELWRETVHNAYSANPDAKFIVNVGDLVDTGQSGAHWNGWFAAAAGVIDRVPEMPVVGNHETYGSTDTTRPEYWNAQFRLPQNGPSGLKNQVYSYDYGPVHFVVLDSQQTEQNQYGDILTAQKNWLDADLAASKATWKIAFFHKGAYSLKDGRDNKDVRDAFCPVIDRHHVDLVFNGHDHAIGRTYPIKDGKFVSKPSQGTIYYVTGRSGAKFYTDVRKRAWNSFFCSSVDQPDYFVVEVADSKLTIKTVKTDGTLVDTFTIDKNNDRLSTGLAYPVGILVEARP